jgi:hypothetical protein
MRRREFTSLLGGAAAAWPISASAQHATPPGLPATPAPGEALAQTRYRTIDVGGLDIFYQPVQQGRRSYCCSTVFRHRLACSETSFRCSPTSTG